MIPPALIALLSFFLLQSPSPQPAFILQPTSLVTQPPKTKEPPRYEEAVKQSRNFHINNTSQVRCTHIHTHTHSHTHQISHNIFFWQFSAASAFRIHKILQVYESFFSVIQPREIVFHYWQSTLKYLILLAVFSGSHGNQPADG